MKYKNYHHREYYASDHWKSFSKSLLDDKSAVCEICGRPRWKLVEQGKNKGKYKLLARFNVHHKHYDTVGYEQRSDVMVICKQCHDICHAAMRSKNVSPMYKELAAYVEARGFYYKL